MEPQPQHVQVVSSSEALDRKTENKEVQEKKEESNPESNNSSCDKLKWIFILATIVIVSIILIVVFVVVLSGSEKKKDDFVVEINLETIPQSRRAQEVGEVEEAGVISEAEVGEESFEAENIFSNIDLNPEDYEIYQKDKKLDNKKSIKFESSSKYSIKIKKSINYFYGIFQNQLMLSLIELKLGNNFNAKELDLEDFAKGCKNLQNFKISSSSSSTTSISTMTSAFQDCENLETVDLGKSSFEDLYSIDYTFYGCKKLKSNNLENLFKYVFENEINGYITSFEGCSSLDESMRNSIEQAKQNAVAETYVEGEWYTIRESSLFAELSWDFESSNTYDLDSSITTFSDCSLGTYTFFGNLNNYGGHISLNHDDLTGEGDGPDEILTIHLNAIPRTINSFAISVNSYRGQSIKYAKSASLTLIEGFGGRKIGEYSISDTIDTLGLVMGYLKKDSHNVWKLKLMKEKLSGNIIDNSPEILGYCDKYKPEDPYEKMMNQVKTDRTYKRKGETLYQIGMTLLKDGFEPEFVAGVLGNIWIEGEIGQFEIYSSTNSYMSKLNENFDYSNKFSGKKINKVNLKDVVNMVQTLKSQSWSNGKFGLGCVQWTGERTYELVQLYKERATNGGAYVSLSQATRAEAKMISNELNKNSGKYKNVYNDWKHQTHEGENGAYQAGSNICLYYEVPKNKEAQAIERGNHAKSIYKIMMKN